MSRITLKTALIATLAGVVVLGACASRGAEVEDTSLSEFTIPADYRDWRLISVAREEGELDDVRAILGNDVAVEAYRRGTLPFPDGAIIARVAWSYDSSAENDAAFGQPQSFVAGAPKNGLQFMVKEAQRYASTGGWRFAHFDDGRLAGAAKHASCFACHEAVPDRDWVFTRYAR